MKLRNKKTGGLANCEPIEVKTDAGFHDYYSLAELNADWEDYIPAESLIKDEKIRKAVRAWAEALDENTIIFDKFSQGFSFGDGNVFSSINFDGYVFDLVDGGKYTIDELCGEEK